MKYNIAKGQKKGTIVFIHGNSSSSKVYKDIMVCPEIECSKISLDLPGHGSNLEGYIHDEDFSLINYRNKLIAFINAIDDDVLLVGNSLGGHLAIEISKDIKRLKGLVVFGTPPVKKPINLEEAFLPVAALQTYLTENPTEEDIQSAMEVAVYDVKYANSLKEDFKKSNPKVRKAVFKAVSENKFLDQFEMFVNLGIPKFIIAGSHDPSVNPEYLKMVSEACNGNCELIHFENCGHYSSLENPKEFAETINVVANKVFK
ncbi:alpha/beta fold hydrolase [Thalassobellus citreus]|uniref:alpha/beta fold hydrolase n=1 Tax=Thalassobellus citreus TaxID=3367752 RepID=UPI0037A9505F